MKDKRSGAGRMLATEQLWRQRVVQQPRSKLSIREFCQRAGVSEASFYAWRRELARRDADAGQSAAIEPALASRQAEPALSKSDMAGGRAISQPRFLPVAIDGNAPAAPAASPAPTSANHVELLLPSGLVVRVPAHDLAALQAVLELLERPAC